MTASNEFIGLLVWSPPEAATGMPLEGGWGTCLESPREVVEHVGVFYRVRQGLRRLHMHPYHTKTGVGRKDAADNVLSVGGSKR